MITGMCGPDPEAARRWAVMEASIAEDAKVTAYFEALGYTVGWDQNRTHGSWHEIKDSKGDLICQIDMGVPLADIVEDMTAMAAGRPGTSGSDYTICAPPGCPRLFALAGRVAKNQFGGIQENLPL